MRAAGAQALRSLIAGRALVFSCVIEVFFVFVLLNVFFMWSFPAWFAPFEEADGLVSPAVDTWIIGPVAAVIAMVQAPTFAIVNGSGLDRQEVSYPAIALVLLWSGISTTLYAPLVLLARWALRKRRERGRPTKSRS
jgi:hypothetical protein